ncbi:MAG TPA: fatty acid--CoA ligase [Treponema sp.]|nr:fatty acid--CoA ligase [Treponema sp.]
MNSFTQKTPSAYEFPLLIKHLLFAPISYDPDQEIVYKGSIRYTYREFRERVSRLAAALIKLGVKKGDTVAVMDWDSNRYLECYFAIPMIGAVLHTINVRLSPEQMIYTISHAEDSVILVHADFLPILESVKGRLDAIRSFVLLAEDDTPVTSSFSFSGEYESLVADAVPLEEFPEFDEHTRATTFYTTGTTGLPKAVYFSHRQITLHAVTNAASLASIHGGPNFHSEDVYMPITPMFHVHAWGIPFIATFLGVKQVYPGRYVPPLLNSLIESEGVTFSHCVPTILSMLLKDPGSQSIDFSNWKVIIGGAALPKALANLAMDRGINIFAGYGMSETAPVISLTRISTDETKLDRDAQIARRVRTGSPAGLVYARVVDSKGDEVPHDDKSAGEILLRAPWLTQGYYKDSSNSEKLWAGGWMHSQDVSTIDSSGSLRITDRLKDVIKVGGEWLSSLEIEDIVATHPAVSETAVVGSYDEKWGEVPLACVVLKAGEDLSAHKVVEHVKSYIDRGLLPREAILLKVRFIDEIDKTSVGKANKLTLREKYSEKM